jgi:hypothetical protein
LGERGVDKDIADGIADAAVFLEVTMLGAKEEK